MPTTFPERGSRAAASAPDAAAAAAGTAAVAYVPGAPAAPVPSAVIRAAAAAATVASVRAERRAEPVTAASVICRTSRYGGDRPTGARGAAPCCPISARVSAPPVVEWNRD